MDFSITKHHKHRNHVYPVEIFFDLVFVFCMSSVIRMTFSNQSGTLDLYSWGVFLFCCFCSLQIWVFETLVMNRYGTNHFLDRACQFVIMFLMYFMIVSMNTEWNLYFLFNFAWIAVFAVLCVQWASKLTTVDELTLNEKKSIQCMILIMIIQMGIILFATMVLSPIDSMTAQWACLAAIIIGFIGLGIISFKYPNNPHPNHLKHRCAELVILVMGEAIISIGKMLTHENETSLFFFLFVIVLGLFFYNFDTQKRIMHKHVPPRSIPYMLVQLLIVFALANVALGIEFVIGTQYDSIWSLVWLNGWLNVYIVLTMLYAIWNDLDKKLLIKWIIGRIVVVLIFVVVMYISPLYPAFVLGIDALVLAVAGLLEFLLLKDRERNDSL